MWKAIEFIPSDLTVHGTDVEGHGFSRAEKAGSSRA
jgi:hypothetical protein